jgi:hypothetical protein
MNQIALECDRLRVVVDGSTGAFRQIDHRPAGISLIAQPEIAARNPFLIVFADGTTLQTWQSCVVSSDRASQSMTVAWTLERMLELKAQLHLDAETGDLRCTLTLENPESAPVAAVAYPYVAGIGRLGAEPEGDELVHPYATGFVVRNPLDHLPPVTGETMGDKPVVLGLYPEGFSGSTMQFMAYSAVGRGGFYVAAEDGAGREKWLNFYRHPEGDLRLSVWHGPDNYADERSVKPDYVTVLAALDGGTWYDAAERYKTWAVEQSWVAQGPLWSREDRSRRLLEEIGVCTFGINPRWDRSPWLTAIDEIAGTPVLHVLGPNWSRVESNYMNNHPGGLADWFPATFNPENLRVIRENHDYLVPFEFDLLFGRAEGSSDTAAGTEALQVIPRPTLSRDAYDFPFLCPVTPFARDLHVARDRTLAGEYGVDGVYYDISVNNVRHICLSSEHGHEPGDTVALTAAYRALLADTAGAMRDATAGRVVPQGTEMINEQMLPVVAFYQARAEASPASTFEAGPFRNLIKAGMAEKIPLFAYVYHEYGPVRLDGWAKLSREQGEFVYFVLGRVFLQGGLIELNYEFSGLEDLDESSDAAVEHYFAFDRRQYAIDPELAEFVSVLSRARVGRANRYLAYGAMRRPAPFVIRGEATIELDYFLYNCAQNIPEYEDRGVMTVPTVLQTAWQYRDQSAAWLLLNVGREETRIELTLDPSMIDELRPGTYTVTECREGKQPRELGHLSHRRVVELTLPPRCPVLLEALPSSMETT